MMIKKATVLKLIENLKSIDALSRKKTPTVEETKTVCVESLKAVRSLLTTLRKLK